jgi:hypothetical protein
MREIFSSRAKNLLYTSKKESGLVFSPESAKVSSGFNFIKQQKVYLFLSYNTLGRQNNKIIQDLQYFIFHTKGLMQERYSNPSKFNAA